MTHIKNHNHAHAHRSHNDSHHHFVHKQKNGHDFTYLLCDKQSHIHSGKHISTDKKGVEKILYAIDGVKVVSSKPHANHSGHTGVKHSKGASSAVKPKRKLRRPRAENTGGEAGQAMRRKQRAAAKAAPTEAPNTSPDSGSVNPTAANAAQPQSNLAQFLAANPSLKVKLYPISQDGSQSNDTSSGIAIIKQPDGKCVVMGENSSATFDLETTDPEKPTPKDLQMIAARLKSADPAQKLYVGKFVEAQGAAPASGAPTNMPNDPTAAPAGAPNTQPLSGPIGGGTQIQPNGGETPAVPATPAEPATPELPAAPAAVPPAK
jgi:hypothetical protein